MDPFLLHPEQELSALHADYSCTVGSHGMPHHHVHTYYEISLILCGNLHILSENASQSGNGSFLLLMPPGAPHRVARDPLAKYERLNVNFPKGYIEDYVADGPRLLAVFGSKGKILTLTEAQKEQLYPLANDIYTQNDPFRQRLLLLLYLAEIESLCSRAPATARSAPPHISKALQYLHQNYGQKITAEHLAWQAGVGRTTLMTGFKQYTGNTLSTYLTQYRLQMALRLLKQGQSQQAAAEQCGFSDAGTLIRAFRRHYGTTPHKYLHQ